MLENKLKRLIIEKFGSVRQFSFSIGIPYTTIDSILKRGIDNSNVGNVIKICKALDISIDNLLDNKEIISSLDFDNADMRGEHVAEFFSTNLKYLREKNGLSQNKLAEKVGVNQTTIARWEDDNRIPTIDSAVNVASVLNIPLTDLIGKDLRFDNAELIDVNSDIIQIPVFGTIKAGIPIESQNDIIEYIDIPKKWTKGGKKFYGLKISGDSMLPKYNENDIVIFEQTNDIELYNGKDCAIMINGTESTFKKVLINDQGIVLQPYNTAYDIMMFSKEQVEQLPIKIVGLAVEKRTRL